MQLVAFDYDRQAAVDYAHKWAYFRNPQFYDFNAIGGDCTNFISQCVFAGTGVMNYTPNTGWFYINLNYRAPAWTGVTFFYDFITQNQGTGPYGREVDISQIQPGDVIQMAIEREQYHHSVIVVSVDGTPALDTIRVAAHYRDSDCRPINSYPYLHIRFIHIQGARYLAQDSTTPQPPTPSTPSQEPLPQPPTPSTPSEEESTPGQDGASSGPFGPLFPFFPSTR